MPDLVRYVSAIEAELRSAVRTDEPLLSDFYGWMQYHLGWADENLHPALADSGKRLRPVFCLLSCEMIGGQFEPALPGAAAIELLHNFSLVHDDIEDGDKLRRHRATLWTLVGVPHAVNTGDALFALAQRQLLRLAANGLPAERVLRASEIFQRTCIQIVEGQFLDMHGEQMAQTGLAYYKQMVAGKTAALLGAALAIGACAASDDASIARRYRELGVELGMAFQMADDILGLWGDPNLTGKPAGADLRRKKKSLPIIFAQSDPGELGTEMQHLFAQDEMSDNALTHVMQLMDAADIRRQAEREAEKHRHRATRILTRIIADGVASESAANTLDELANSLTKREV